MFDKHLFNNELLAHKKNVTKAKAVIINKIVKKIKNLKSLSEKKPDDLKIRQKLSRNIEILKFLSRSKPMECLKKCLTETDKDYIKVISNSKSLPEDIAEALFASSKHINVIINSLKSKFSLNDKLNPGWKDKIQELSKKQQKQLRTNFKKEIRQERKKRHEIASKRKEWLEEHLDVSIKTEDTNPDSHVGNNVIVKTEYESKKMNKLKLKDVVDKTNSKDEKITKSVDSFFLTQSGEQYLATAVDERVQPLPVTRNVQNHRTNKSLKPGLIHMQEDPKNNFNSTNKKVHKLHPSWEAKQKQNQIVSFCGKKTNFENNSEEKSKNNELHPSWLAKQKQSGIKEFTGNRKLFDIDAFD